MVKATGVHPTTTLLHTLLQPVIVNAWRGKDSPVKRSIAHEANHVARLVHAAPPGIVQAIKGLPGVTAATVQGVFCHKKPLAFWDDANDPTGLSRRELADLMVEVEIATPSETASRALLIQVKMGDEPAWGSTVSLRGLDAGQRQLYADLPDFCMEFGIQYEVTKKDLVKGNVRTIAPPSGFTTYPYKLAGRLINLRARGLVYVAVDRKHRSRVQSATPWLAEQGRPSRSPLTSATFDVDFALALAEMVVEQRPRFGLRSDGKALVRDWANLIDEVKHYAAFRSTQRIWTGRKALDVELRKNPTTSVLDHVAAFATDQGVLESLWIRASSAPRPPYLDTPFGPFHDDLFDVGPDGAPQRYARVDESSDVENRAHGDEGPPLWPGSVEREPEGGFGLLSLRIEVDDR